MIALLGIAVMLVLMFLGMNVGTAMFCVGFLGYAVIVNFNAAVGLFRTAPMAQAMKYSFMVIPLFTLMGNAAFEAGLSAGLYDFARKWLSRIPGALACATILASAAFGAICGSSTATVSTMGTVAVPEMRKYGYSDKLAVGTVAAAGGLGVLIPPSGTMIIYGVSTELSISQLFMAGVLPGILLALLLMLVVQIWCRINKSLAPSGEKCAWIDRFKSLKGIIGVVILFLLVLGGMFVGIFTVNEAAAIGAFLGLLLMIVYHKFTIKSCIHVMKATVKNSAMIFWLILGATVFGNFLTISKLPMNLAAFIQDLDVSKYVVFLIIIVIYAGLGMIMDAAPMILLTIPIFYPVITNLGFDGIWFGVIIVLVVNLGFITPPVGMNCYVIKGVVKDIPLPTVFAGSAPFIFAIIAAVLICTIFPQLATWIPSMM
jgi:tripartite ATP-independent transporter DctM subunit